MNMDAAHTVTRSWMVRDFVCIGAACPDTCCKGWSMQVDTPTIERYEHQAPELLEAVVAEGDDAVMRRNISTDYCVKYEDGWCGIQRQRGTDFLSDACHFYPRITRTLGEREIVSAALSCPEIARLALFAPREESFSTRTEPAERLPVTLRDYLPEGMDVAEAWQLHLMVIDEVLKADTPPEHVILHLLSLCQSLEKLPVACWAEMASLHLRQPHPVLPAPESHAADSFNLLNVLLALIGASTHAPSLRLQQTLREMIAGLQVTVDPVMVTLLVSESSATALQQMQERWKLHYRPALAPLLSRLLAAQLSASTFPFAGPGDTLADRATLLAMRYATLTLALMSACETAGGPPAEEDIIRIVQSLSRFTDHLAESRTALQLYRQVGFDTLARIHGLLAF